MSPGTSVGGVAGEIPAGAAAGSDSGLYPRGSRRNAARSHGHGEIKIVSCQKTTGGEAAMNCKECQERILEALAAGASQLSREASEHQRNCPVCREFGDAQVSLFRSMDAGLHAMVNQSVPPSLLAGLRARLDRPPVTRLGWIPQWSYALLAVVAILIMSIGYVSRRPGDRPNLLGSTPAVSRNASNPVLEVQPARKSPTTSLRPTHKRADREVPSLASSESEP